MARCTKLAPFQHELSPRALCQCPAALRPALNICIRRPPGAAAAAEHSRTNKSNVGVCVSVCSSQKGAGMSLNSHTGACQHQSARAHKHISLRASLEEARLMLDVVLLPPLPPGALQVLDALLLGRRRLQVPLLETPARRQRRFSANKQILREFGHV